MAFLGGSDSNVFTALTSALSESETAVCQTQNVCQTAKIGEIDVEGKINCDNINWGVNTNSQSFGCAAVQSAVAVANIANTIKNYSEAALGTYSAADTENSIGSAMTIHQKATCGGVPSSVGGGSCRTGVVQSATVDKMIVSETGSVGCKSWAVANNMSDTTVSCHLSQAAKADGTINNAVKQVAKGQNILAVVLALAILGTIFMLIGPWALKRTIAALHYHSKRGARRRRHATLQDQLRDATDVGKLQVQQLQNIAREKMAKKSGERITVDDTVKGMTKVK